MLIGHVAVAILQHHYLDADLAPVMAGGLFPDVVDKTLHYVLRVTPSGRMWSHTALSLGLSTGAVWLLAGRRTARSWALGFAGHLLVDGGDEIPWWYPFKSYTFTPSPGLREILERFAHDRRKIAVEVGLLLWALFVLAAEVIVDHRPGKPHPARGLELG